MNRTCVWLAFGASFLSACGDESHGVDGGAPRVDAAVSIDSGSDAGAARADASSSADGGERGWRTEPSLPSALQEISAAVIDDRVYVAGGFEGLTVVDTVRIYDPATGSWSEGPALPARLHHLALVAVGRDLYSIGGMAPGGFNAVDSCFVLREGAGAWAAIAPLPEPRAAMAAGSIDGKIYVAAGQGRGGALLGPVLEYDPAVNRWSARAALADPREHVGGFVYDGELWVVGGRDLSLTTATNAVAIYDPSADEWRAGPSLNVAHGGGAAAVFGDIALVVGGEMPAMALDAAERIRLPKGAWELVEPIPTQRHGHAMAALLGRFYVIGGGDEPIFAAVDTVESYAP